MPTAAARDPFLVAADIIAPPPDERKQRYLRDPIAWLEERLGEFAWSKQREIAQSIVANRKTAVPSCFGSGKSWLASRLVGWWLDCHEPGEAFVVTTASTGAQVKAILWREIGRAFAAGGLSGRLNKTEWWMTMRDGREELVAFGRKPQDMDATAFQGIHAPYVLVVVDEAAGVPKALINGAEGLIVNEDSRILAIGNPDQALSGFHEMCSPGSGYHVIPISAWDTPNFTGEYAPVKVKQQLISKVWVEEKRLNWGEDNPEWMAKVEAKFPTTREDALIPMEAVRAAQNRDLPAIGTSELGVDVGGGGDKNVVCHRTGGRARIIRKDQVADTMRTAGNVIHDLERTKAVVARVDRTGIGWGAVDRLLEQKKPVVGVLVGEAASDPERFANKRAEFWWGVRERFVAGDVDIDPRDQDLAAQLVDIRFHRNSRGQIVIEEKKEMKRRGRKSPDEADALMLSFAPEQLAVREITW